MSSYLSRFFEEQARTSAAEQSYSFACFMTPLALAFEVMVALRNSLFDLGWIKARRLPGLVISVGNIATGGTGKTPFVSLLIRQALERGYVPVVLSRGYGAKIGRRDSWVLRRGALFSKRGKDFFRGSGTPVQDELPDEPRMLSELFPDVSIVCGPARWQGAKWYMKSQDRPLNYCWILDDGFQHRRLLRDHDVVLLDAVSPFGNGWTLPRGVLREPGGSLVRSTELIFSQGSLNNLLSNDPVGLKRPRYGMHPKALHTIPVSPTAEDHIDMKGREVVLVTGIARPERFRGSCVDKLGVLPQKVFYFRDHYRLKEKDFAALNGIMVPILITDKDYWRQPNDWGAIAAPVFRVKVDWSVDPLVWPQIFGGLDK